MDKKREDKKRSGEFFYRYREFRHRLAQELTGSTILEII